MLKYLRRLLLRSPKPARPAALSSSILGNIPVEILLYIITFLPPESAAALSLTCSDFKALFGAEYYEKVNTPPNTKLVFRNLLAFGTENYQKISSSRHTKLAFLNLLAIDLPHQIVCAPCGRLHHMKNLLRYNPETYRFGSRTWRHQASQRPACVQRDSMNMVDHVTSIFGTTAFKMAVKQHQLHPESSEVLELMSSKTAETISRGCYIQQSTEECRVAQGHLLHRLQSVYILCCKSTSLGDETFKDYYFEDRLCPHIHRSKNIRYDTSGIRRCRRCRTDYRIEYKYYDDLGIAMHVTSWKDLGSSPEDIIWRRHLPGNFSEMARLVFVRNRTSSPTHSKVHDEQIQEVAISSAFEDCDSIESNLVLTAKNKKELLRFRGQCFNH